MKVVVILNPGSGTLSVAENREILLGALREAGMDQHVIDLSNGGDIEAELRPHLDQGCDMVVAAGGDGTVNAVAAIVAGTKVSLGVIPGGTLNHFANDVGIPQDLAEAVAVLKSGVAKRVDVGAVNGRIFVNNSGLGLYPEMVMKREEIQRHGFRKATALAMASLLTLFRFPLLRVRLEANGQAIERFTPFVFLGNNAYEVEGLQFGVRPRLDQGNMCVWVARRSRRFGLVRAVTQMAFRGLSGVQDLDVFSAREVVIKPRRKIVPVSIDGEVFKLPTPLHYELRPGALRVIVPSPAEPE